jgi:hypothetical protein
VEISHSCLLLSDMMLSIRTWRNVRALIFLNEPAASREFQQGCSPVAFGNRDATKIIARWFQPELSMTPRRAV